MLRREAPWVWDVCEAANLVESTSIDGWLGLSTWLRGAVRVVCGERHRQREVEFQEMKLKAEAKRGR